MTRAQLGNITRLSKGRYRLTVERGRDGDGKRLRETKVVRGTRDAAEIELAKMRLAADKPIDADMTVEAFWTTFYLPSLSNLEKSSVAQYTAAYERHLRGLFGSTMLSDLTTRDVERKLLTIEKPHPRHHAYKVMRQLVNQAWNWDMIENNPFLKKMRISAPRTVEQDVMTAAELAKWTEAMRDYTHEATVLLCAHAGLRREEACALEWPDIQFAPRGDGAYAFVRIDKAATDYGLKPTKTARSTRTVVVAGNVAMRLLELSGDGRVFAGRDGAEIQPNRLSRSYKAWCGKAGVRYVSVKNLRNTYATIQQTVGTDSTVTSRALGHTKLATDYNHYFVTQEEAFVSAADAFAAKVSSQLAHDGTR